MRLAIAVPASKNAKLGGCATTYAAQASCPGDCPFLNGGGCYAENGRIATSTTNPLNAAAASAFATALDVAKAEAAAIDALIVVAGKPIRLHTVGDCASDEAARIVSAAAERYMGRGGGPAWTYTHGWRIVDRASWGRVSVLASCETGHDARAASARGYAPSLVVEDFSSVRRYYSDSLETELLPCPAQTHDDVSCDSCRLCMDDGALRGRRYAIAFAIHGTQSVIKAAVKALRDPEDPGRRLTSRDHAYRLHDELGRWPSPGELAAAADVTWSSAREMLNRVAA